MNTRHGMDYVTDPHLFPRVREPASRWERAGLTPRQEYYFDRGAWTLIVLFAIGWAYAVATRPRPSDVTFFDTPLFGPSDPGQLRDPLSTPLAGQRITQNPLDPASDPLAPTVTGAVLERAAREYAARLPREVRGISGDVYVQILPPEASATLPAAARGSLAFRGAGGLTDQLAGGPGIFSVVLRIAGGAREVPNLSVIRLVPMSAKKNGKIGAYKIGDWPCEVGRCPANPIYATPPGMIEVTPQNKEMYLSKHIQLKDYITKLQESIWPKYVVVVPKNLDKIQLVIQELEAMGHPVHNIFAVSGFRSPWYNANGGVTQGRGELSRHMYGDAMDIAVDNDYNGIMDDLNGDGKIDLKDARVIGEAVDRVEAKYPELVGGMHYYPPTGGHRGMVHIDSRGRRARW